MPTVILEDQLASGGCESPSKLQIKLEVSELHPAVVVTTLSGARFPAGALCSAIASVSRNKVDGRSSHRVLGCRFPSSHHHNHAHHPFAWLPSVELRHLSMALIGGNLVYPPHVLYLIRHP